MHDVAIAVVNSDQALLRLLQLLLTEAGYETRTYHADCNTHRHLRETQPRLVVLDVGLQASAPGWPLLNLLQFDPQTEQIPILITTVDHAFVREQQPRLQDWFVLELPDHVNDLVQQVRQLIVADDVRVAAASPQSSY